MTLIEEVIRLRRLEQAATLGDWKKAIYREDKTYNPDIGVYTTEDGWSVCQPSYEPDADLIVLSRNSLPEFLDVLDAFQHGDAELLQWLTKEDTHDNLMDELTPDLCDRLDRMLLRFLMAAKKMEKK